MVLNTTPEAIAYYALYTMVQKFLHTLFRLELSFNEPISLKTSSLSSESAAITENDSYEVRLPPVPPDLPDKDNARVHSG
ncbi:hypothetical protein SAMN05216387_101316 [Nitrosovibrio tenuis]|uniref:Uncharacterized protein n=1 Tax=Nitrosovibrio tenuis TaxID=1233 RepID=A0A1H7GLL9_9PROT|nr:hypothetical protein SAMN05216387_101316 [Nitrosovibrio tenuis]